MFTAKRNPLMFLVVALVALYVAAPSASAGDPTASAAGIDCQTERGSNDLYGACLAVGQKRPIRPFVAVAKLRLDAQHENLVQDVVLRLRATRDGNVVDDVKVEKTVTGDGVVRARIEQSKLCSGRYRAVATVTLEDGRRRTLRSARLHSAC